MKKVRIGLVGAGGGMAQFHAKNLQEGKIPLAELAAVCDIVPGFEQKYPGVPFFHDHRDLFRSGKIDAALIVTPHYYHTTQGIDALRAGLHVLVEKPISVHKLDCQKLIAAHRNKKQVFAAMFNQRTDPHYLKVRELIRSGELGEIRRIHWTITNWFRSAAYYSSGSWRATWGGEGGGVLLNQCPHNIDLFQWLFGMPQVVHGFCQLGRYHDIEVEDDVTAYFEYKNKTTATFITSTGEAPGTNRLEVAAERGRLVLENGRLHFTRNEIPMSEFSRTTTQSFAAPATWEIEIPIQGTGGQHIEIIQNFAEAILHHRPLIAPAAEGLHSVELANAILYSSLRKKPVTLPLNPRAYASTLAKLIKASKAPKKVVKKTSDSTMSGSFR
jgi:predicted dehydrogenase